MARAPVKPVPVKEPCAREVRVVGKLMDVSDAQPEKALFPNVVKLSPRITVVSFVQSWKALAPKVVMAGGRVTAVRAVPLKALPPIEVRFSRFTEANATQPSKALFGTAFNPLPRVTLARLVQFTKALVPRLVTVSGIASVVRAAPLKALVPIEVRLKGKLIDVSAEQPEKALFPRDATSAPKVTLTRFVQPIKALLAMVVMEFGMTIFPVKPEF